LSLLPSLVAADPKNEGRNDKEEAGSTVCASYNSGAVKSAASVWTASKSLI